MVDISVCGSARGDGTYPVGLAGFGGDDCYDVDGHCGCCVRFSVWYVYMQYMKSNTIIQRCGCDLREFSALPWVVKAERCRGTLR